MICQQPVIFLACMCFRITSCKILQYRSLLRCQSARFNLLGLRGFNRRQGTDALSTVEVGCRSEFLCLSPQYRLMLQVVYSRVYDTVLWKIVLFWLHFLFSVLIFPAVVSLLMLYYMKIYSCIEIYSIDSCQFLSLNY